MSGMRIPCNSPSLRLPAVHAGKVFLLPSGALDLARVLCKQMDLANAGATVAHSKCALSFPPWPQSLLLPVFSGAPGRVPGMRQNGSLALLPHDEKPGEAEQEGC